MKKEIKNATILEKTVRPDKAQMLKQVQHDMEVVQDDMGWLRCGFGALAPDKVFSPLTSHLSPSHFSRRAASRIIRVVTGVTSRSTSRVGFAIAHTAPYRKFGFTLAEVLITLGIIGVVAAMTMPTLIAKIQRNILNNQFKKMYSVLTTAFQKTNFEMDFFNGCYYIQGKGSAADYSGCQDFFYNHLSKNLNVAKICDTKAYENGCAPDYDWSSFPSDGCTGGFTSDGLKSNGAIVLNDGSIIYLSSYMFPMIASDINGKKGPNKPGFDVYSYEIYRVGSNLILNPPIKEERSMVTHCMPNAGGVRYYDEIMK